MCLALVFHLLDQVFFLLHKNNRSIISISGVDPSGGAGLAADVRACAALNIHCLPIATTLTAQSNTQFFAQWPVATETILAQLDAVLPNSDEVPVKIGAVGHPSVDTLAKALSRRLHNRFVVYDPVLKSSSGGAMSAKANELRRHLVPVATLLTPNLLELEALSGRPVDTQTQRIDAARDLFSNKTVAVLVKGGHADSENVEDLLVLHDKHLRFAHPRLSIQARGTGCVLASAICAFVARGHELESAVKEGIEFVTAQLESDRGVFLFLT